MAAKGPRGPIHNSYLTSHLRELRLYELDRVYLRQLRRLSQIVWNAKLKRDHTLPKSAPNPLDGITTPTDTANPSQKTPL